MCYEQVLDARARDECYWIVQGMNASRATATFGSRGTQGIETPLPMKYEAGARGKAPLSCTSKLKAQSLAQNAWFVLIDECFSQAVDVGEG